MPEECLKEMKVTICNITHTIESTLSLGNIICCENFSHLQKLLRVTAYVLRFVKHCMARKMSEVTIDLVATEIADAETLWLRESQKGLLEHKDFLQWKQQFGLVLEEKMWRCKGRWATLIFLIAPNTQRY